MALSVFIGSSTEKKELAKAVAKELSEKGYSPVRWWHEFPLGSLTIDRLVEISREVDGAVFIFGSDDKVWYRGTHQDSPRDNVLLEYGIFLNQLGRDRCVIARDHASKLPTDLAGLTYEPVHLDIHTTSESLARHFDLIFRDDSKARTKTVPILTDPQLIGKQLQATLPDDWFQRDLYLGVSCARRWLAVTRSLSGAIQRQQRFVDQNVIDVAQMALPQTFLSFGPGDANLDKDIVLSLKRDVPSIQYIPVDICHGLLSHAVKTISEHVRTPVGIVGDFEDGIGFIKSQLLTYVREPMLVSLLGNTFGNLDKHERSFLNAIHALFGSQADWLLLEVFTKGPNWSWDRDKHARLDGYPDELRKFVASGIYRRDGVCIEDVVGEFEDWVKFEEGVSDVPEATTINITNKRTERRIFSMRKYDWDSLCGWLESRGFEIVRKTHLLESDGVRGTGIALLKGKVGSVG